MIFLNLNLHYIFKLLKVYYNPQRYWKGLAAIKKLAAAAKVSDDAAKKWVIKQTPANLSSCPKAHSWPQIRCTHDKCSSPSRPFFIT